MHFSVDGQLYRRAVNGGEPLPPAIGLPPSIRAVPVALFRTELLARGIVGSGSKNPRARFRELLNGLKVRNLAAERDERIWPILKVDRDGIMQRPVEN